MKIADYLFDHSITPEQLRRMLGVKDRSTVYRWLTGENIPQPSIIQKLVEFTGGQVQLIDFLDRAPPKCAKLISTDGRQRIVLPWSKLPYSRLQKDSCPESPSSRLSPPIKRALRVLEGRAWYTPRGKFLLDGRVTDLRRVVQAANEVLKGRGEPPIFYPGAEPLS